MRNLTPLLLAFSLAACGGGAGSPAFVQPAGTLMTPSPSNPPTQTPIVALSPSSAPATATPVPLGQRAIAGAPLSATISQLSRVRTQAKTQAQGVTNGLPILVESSGMVAAWAGDQAVWATNAQTSADIPETSGTITPSGNLALNNPGFAPLSCLGSVSAVCIVHPMGFEFGTTSANGKPVGKQTLTIAFADGTTGSTVDDVYDGWSLPCNAGWAYVGGVPVAQATRATSDVYADCVNGNIDFPQGAQVLAQPAQDQYGRYETLMPTFTAAPIFAAANGVVSMASIVQGIIFSVITHDGGFAKVYFSSGAGSGAVLASFGMSIHSEANGAYAY